MFQFIGHDFFGGMNALSITPTSVENIKSTELRNAVFDHFNVTRNINLFGEKAIPAGWTYDDILNATFNNDINAGNIEGMVNRISGIKIKRRVRPVGIDIDVLETDVDKYQWITLKYIPIDTVEDLTFTFNDFLNAYDIEYDYALVPVIEEVEGQYIVDHIHSNFTGIFIGDQEQSFRFLYDVNYSSNARNQQVGTFTPLGREYPIIVANGVLSYETGNFSATILDEDFEKTGVPNRAKIVEKKNTLKDFLTNKKPKILKDLILGRFYRDMEVKIYIELLETPKAS